MLRVRCSVTVQRQSIKGKHFAPLHFAPFSAVAGSERVRNLVGLSECSHLLRQEEPCTIRNTCVCGIFGQCQAAGSARSQKCKWNDLLPAEHTAHFPARSCPLCHAMLHEIRPLTSPGTLSLLLSSLPRSSVGSSYRIRLMLLGRGHCSFCCRCADSPASLPFPSLLLSLSVSSCKRNITCRTSNLLASF